VAAFPAYNATNTTVTIYHYACNDTACSCTWKRNGVITITNNSDDWSVTSNVYDLYPVKRKGLQFRTKKDMYDYFSILSWADLHKDITSQYKMKPNLVFRSRMAVQQKQHNKRRFYLQKLNHEI
jgi:hypothetical protein